MNFLEKNLESIIFDDLDFCRTRGLDLEPIEVWTWRQLNLAPYGTADLVQACQHTHTATATIRIIECKRNVINSATYGQALRYMTALRHLMEASGYPSVDFEVILIGQRVDAAGDFWHMVENDPYCRVYTYTYAGDGIHFQNWFHKRPARLDTPPTSQTAEFLAKIAEAVHAQAFELVADGAE